MDWKDYLPNPESQVSLNDTDACVSYATIHAIESQIYKITGQRIDLSERFLAKMSGTTLQGNYVQKVLDTVKAVGLVTDADWPEPLVFDWQSYYAEIPAAVIAKGKKFLEQWDIQTFLGIDEGDIDTALTHAPLITIITKESPNHCVERINAKEYFDSYPNWLKMISTVHSNHQIIIKRKVKPMLVFKFDDHATEYVLVDDATLIGIASQEALDKTAKGRTVKMVVLPAAQRADFTIADSAIN